MAAYVIAQLTVHDLDPYYEYAARIFVTLKPYGGRIMAANDAEVREGTVQHVRTIVGEFPSLEQARAWYDSEAYQAIIGLRLKSTDSVLFMVEGLTMPARPTNHNPQSTGH